MCWGTWLDPPWPLAHETGTHSSRRLWIGAHHGGSHRPYHPNWSRPAGTLPSSRRPALRSGRFRSPLLDTSRLIGILTPPFSRWLRKAGAHQNSQKEALSSPATARHRPHHMQTTLPSPPISTRLASQSQASERGAVHAPWDCERRGRTLHAG